jgi:hypothetical protein
MIRGNKMIFRFNCLEVISRTINVWKISWIILFTVVTNIPLGVPEGIRYGLNANFYERREAFDAIEVNWFDFMAFAERACGLSFGAPLPDALRVIEVAALGRQDHAAFQTNSAVLLYVNNLFGFSPSHVRRNCQLGAWDLVGELRTHWRNAAAVSIVNEDDENTDECDACKNSKDNGVDRGSGRGGRWRGRAARLIALTADSVVWAVVAIVAGIV